jgi:hypothetical protein
MGKELLLILGGCFDTGYFFSHDYDMVYDIVVSDNVLNVQKKYSIKI